TRCWSTTASRPFTCCRWVCWPSPCSKHFWGGLRAYVLYHTSSRIDVELGARLFSHLLALPMAYFEARRVGDTVARIRELENIRQFLTSSTVTLLIDVLFTGIFLGVMFIYSPFLAWIVVGLLPGYAVLFA